MVFQFSHWVYLFIEVHGFSHSHRDSVELFTLMRLTRQQQMLPVKHAESSAVSLLSAPGPLPVCGDMHPPSPTLPISAESGSLTFSIENPLSLLQVFSRLCRALVNLSAAVKKHFQLSWMWRLEAVSFGFEFSQHPHICLSFLQYLGRE